MICSQKLGQPKGLGQFLPGFLLRALLEEEPDVALVGLDRPRGCNGPKTQGVEGHGKKKHGKKTRVLND